MKQTIRLMVTIYKLKYKSKFEITGRYTNKKQRTGCYVAAMKPSKMSNRYLYVFFDMECTYDLEKHGGSFEYIPKLICAQQIGAKYESVDNLSVDCEQRGKRIHTFSYDPVRKFIEYLRLSRPFADKICYFTQLLWIRRTISAT